MLFNYAPDFLSLSFMVMLKEMPDNIPEHVRQR